MPFVTPTTPAGSVSFTPNFSIVTSSLLSIPIGASSVAIHVISGGAYINGTGAFPPSSRFEFGVGALAAPVLVGCTGGLTTAYWSI